MTTTVEHSADGLTINDTARTEEYTIGHMATPDVGGDTSLMWDSRNQIEVETARKAFTRLREAGYAAHRVDDNEIITEFDPHAQRIVMIKPIAGG